MIAAISLLFWSCGDDDSSNPDTALTNISLNYKTHEAVYSLDTAVVLKVIFTPENATNKNITWTTSDANIATVSKGKEDGVGIVKGNGIGTCTITASSEDVDYIVTCEIKGVPRCAGIKSTNNELCKNKGTIADSGNKMYCKTHESQVK